jgi:hypothetical protein
MCGVVASPGLGKIHPAAITEAIGIVCWRSVKYSGGCTAVRVAESMGLRARQHGKFCFSKDFVSLPAYAKPRRSSGRDTHRRG